MMPDLLAENCRKKISMQYKTLLTRLTVVLFWTAVWSILAAFLPDFLFAGPLETIQSLFRNGTTLEFWLSIGQSLFKIGIGFLTAFLLGSCLAVCGHCVRVIGLILEPAIQIMKTVPVACFIVVALIWMSSANISILVAFFVVFPMVYINLRQGLNQVNHDLIEMAQVFHVSKIKKLRALYFPEVMPYLLSSCQVGIGMAWKAGVAGEIIGLPDWSIGEQLYRAKLYLNADDLFAWTIVIIVISLICEKMLLRLLQGLQSHAQRGHSV